MDKAKRNKMEKLIYDCFDKLDPSKGNTKKYKDFFSQMSDAQFNTFFKKLFDDDNAYLILEMVDYERELDMVNIENAAKYLEVPLFEKIVMPHVNMDKENPSVTPYVVPIGYAHLKRMQQMLFKKNSTSTNIDIRSSVTGYLLAPLCGNM